MSTEQHEAMSSTIKIKRPDMPVPAQASVTSDSVGRYYNIKSYTLAQMVERDAQWQEMVGPVVQAATALRLALNWKAAVYCNPSNGFEMRMDADNQAWARLDDLSAALSDITEE